MNADALSEYVRRYHTSMFRLAYSYVRNRENAEDIVQEVFLKLYCCDIVFAAEENVKAWLIRVTINKCKDMLRANARRQRSCAEQLTDIPTEQPEYYGIAEYLSRLKPEYSGIIYLYYYEGYSIKEIAAMCRLSGSAVTTRLSRARKQLRKMLTEEEGNEK